MNGVMFGGFHSYEDFTLVLSSKIIESPETKIETVPIPGGDGEIDLTEYFGEPKYSNRNLEFNFSTIAPMDEFLELYTTICNNIHGKKMNIILDEDPNFYYVGRCSVSSWTANGRVGELTVKCNCEPYKYKLNKTIATNSISGSGTITYTNLRKQVVPKFTTDGAIDLSFGGSAFSIAEAGTYTFPNLVFVAGTNSITYTGTASVTVEYQEGAL